MFATGATPRKGSFAAAKVCMTTLFAHITVFPFFISKEFQAVFVSRKRVFKFEWFEFYQRIIHGGFFFAKIVKK